MAAKWPTSVATDADLYVAVNSLQTTLSTSLNSSDVSIVLASATGFPTAGAVTIDNEVIFYTNISGATLTGCTRGSDGTTAASHSAGVPVGASIVAYHHNQLRLEIEAVESWLDTHLGKGTAVVAAEFEYLQGVTSAIQTQFSGKQTTALLSGKILVGNGSNVAAAVTPSSELTMSNGGAFTLDNASVIGKVLTGYVASAGVVAATDSILQAVQKLAATNVIVQYKIMQDSTKTSVTSNTLTDTGLSLAITPMSSSNKILCVYFLNVKHTASNQTNRSQIKVLRGATGISAVDGLTTLSGNLVTLTDSVSTVVVKTVLDSPATTSATTYKVQLANLDAAGTITVNNEAGNTESTLLLLEVLP